MSVCISIVNICIQKWNVPQVLFLKNAHGRGEIAAFFISHYTNTAFKTCIKRSRFESKIIRIKKTHPFKGAKPSVKGKKKPESIRL